MKTPIQFKDLIDMMEKFKKANAGRLPQETPYVLYFLL